MFKGGKDFLSSTLFLYSFLLLIVAMGKKKSEVWKGLGGNRLENKHQKNVK